MLLAIASYAAAVITELIRGHQNLKRDREARREMRQAECEAARDSFERDTLIQLQDTMGSLMRNFAKVVHANELEYRNSGTWGRRMLPEDVGGEMSGALARDFHRFSVRVLDDSLRERIKEWSAIGAQSTIGAMRDEADVDACERARAAWGTCQALYTEVAEMVGQRLRTLVAKW
jgi:hypothetical protein